MDRPAVAPEALDYLRERGFVWDKRAESFLPTPPWRQLREVGGGWTASVVGRIVSPAFPDPISAYVYAEANGWTPEENTL